MSKFIDSDMIHILSLGVDDNDIHHPSLDRINRCLASLNEKSQNNKYSAVDDDNMFIIFLMTF
ncbi:hypothetical protein DERP_007083 [Dermatophagoides pteronyssinus]|uniref:Uncharacterized protein n=1 Tax=Dermatophagoides pteronyssinus TaxID=6956 RepID=A0ABQ8JU39_DERPT|nr:hypothetical protein DERP_007083 [Dermatophagoides pteronyssinus]